MSTEQNRAWREHTAALIASGGLTQQRPVARGTDGWHVMGDGGIPLGPYATEADARAAAEDE